MPTYQYVCKSCAEPLEVVQSFSDDALTDCPACPGELRRVFSSVGVVFKGSGFYRTDSRSSGGSATKGEKPKPSESSSDSATKTEATAKDSSSTASSTGSSSKESSSKASASSGKPGSKAKAPA